MCSRTDRTSHVLRVTRTASHAVLDIYATEQMQTEEPKSQSRTYAKDTCKRPMQSKKTQDTCNGHMRRANATNACPKHACRTTRIDTRWVAITTARAHVQEKHSGKMLAFGCPRLRLSYHTRRTHAKDACQRTNPLFLTMVTFRRRVHLLYRCKVHTLSSGRPSQPYKLKQLPMSSVGNSLLFVVGWHGHWHVEIAKQDWNVP